jgi:hypothetical protein
VRRHPTRIVGPRSVYRRNYGETQTAAVRQNPRAPRCRRRHGATSTAGKARRLTAEATAALGVTGAALPTAPASVSTVPVTGLLSLHFR